MLTAVLRWVLCAACLTLINAFPWPKPPSQSGREVLRLRATKFYYCHTQVRGTWATMAKWAEMKLNLGECRYFLFRTAASVNNEALSRWWRVAAVGGATAAEWCVHSSSPAECRLWLDHRSACWYCSLCAQRWPELNEEKKASRALRPEEGKQLWTQPDFIGIHANKHKKESLTLFLRCAVFSELPPVCMSKEGTAMSHRSSRWFGPARSICCVRCADAGPSSSPFLKQK